MNASSVAEQVRSAGSRHIGDRGRGSRGQKGPMPIPADDEQQFDGRPPIAPDYITRHEDALKRGEIPQELRDKGIVSVTYGSENKVMDNIRDGIDNIRNRFSRADKEPEVAEMESIGEDMPESDRGMDDIGGSDMASEPDAYNSMTDDAFAELPQDEQHRLRREDTAKHTQTASSSIENSLKHGLDEPERFVEVDMGDGTMALAQYSPEDTKTINDNMRNGMNMDDIQLVDSDIADLGSFDQSQSVGRGSDGPAMDSMESANVEATDVQLSSSDISDLSYTDSQSHQL